MADIDQVIHDALKAHHPSPKDAVWKHKQSGKWLAYHKDLEVVAVSAGIRFQSPHIVEAGTAEKIAVVCVTGELGEQMEWSIGEAAPYNNTNGYPWAMAEKRAKDRVILKLIGLHGLVYSEEEADDFKDSAPPQSEVDAPQQSDDKTEAARAAFASVQKAIKAAPNPAAAADLMAQKGTADKIELVRAQNTDAAKALELLATEKSGGAWKPQQKEAA